MWESLKIPFVSFHDKFAFTDYRLCQHREYIYAQGKEKHQLEDTISNLKQMLEAVQNENIAKDREALINLNEYE